jgi:hypothetical protein
MVISPSVSKVQWIPETMCWGPGRCSPSDDTATPKLIDICCMVLAMLLPMLVSALGEVGVDERVHAGELQRRNEARSAKARATISQIGVPGPIGGEHTMSIPMMIVFDSSTRR